MSVTSGFFNSLNGDRRYTAEQFSELINTLVNDGVFQNVGTAFSVTASSGNEITVGIGRCWFNGVWLMNDALYPMTLLDSELLLNRIDAIVIEINHSESVRAGSIRIVKGTPASDPQRPNLTKTDDVHQYPLAYIRRTAGTNEVIQAGITNMVGTSECPYITGILETQDIDKIVAQWESEFNVWFESVQDVLDSDTAAKLAAQLIEMDNKFETLAKERAVYEELTDSNGEMIVDSNALSIQGRTVMAAEGSTASPNAITPVMADNSAKVGDTLTTVRTDLGDEWLLCNGDMIDPIEYPELSTIITAEFNMSRWYSKDIVDMYTQVGGTSHNRRGPYHVNGMDVVLFAAGSFDKIVYAAIRTPDGVWSVKQTNLKQGGSIGQGYIDISNRAQHSMMTYVDGKYVIPQWENIKYNTTSVNIYVSDDLVTWTNKVISITPWTDDRSAYQNKYIHAIVEPSPGKIVIFAHCQMSSYFGSVGFATSLNGPFVFNAGGNDYMLTLDSYDGPRIKVNCANGKAFLLSRHASNDTVPVTYVDPITKSVSGLTLGSTVSFEREGSFSNILYFNGRYYCYVSGVIETWTDGGSVTQASMDFTWENYRYDDYANFGIVKNGEKEIPFLAVYCYANSYLRGAMLEGDTFKGMYNSNANNIESGLFTDIQSIVVGSNDIYAITATSGRYLKEKTNGLTFGIRLPEISLSTAHTYIKAK